MIDLAIIERAESYNMSELLNHYEVVDEIPFDFSRRRMSVVLEDKNGKRQLITKGAVEEILKTLNILTEMEKSFYSDDKTREEAYEVYSQHNNDGLYDRSRTKK